MIIAGLTAQAEDALAAIRQAQAAGHVIAGSAELAAGIRTAMDEKRWAWLRHALTSYPVCKCRDIRGLPAGRPPTKK